MLEIKKIEEIKSLFRVTLSNGSSFFLLPDILYGRSLKEGGIYDEATLNSAMEENSTKLCFDAMLKILRTRMNSTGELRKKLALKKFNYSIIDKTICRAVETGITNDEATAQFYKNELLAKGYGSYRIRDAMMKKGFSKDIIESFTSKSSDNSEEETENARRIFERKLASIKKDKSILKHKLKEKLYRFMQSKGYASETILSLMKDFSE